MEVTTAKLFICWSWKYNFYFNLKNIVEFPDMIRKYTNTKLVSYTFLSQSFAFVFVRI